MDNEFDKQASKILRENLEGLGWSDEYEEVDVDPDNAQGFTPEDIEISIMDDGEWEYDRIGVGKVGDDVFVADVENFGDPNTIWKVNFDSVEDVINSGLESGWLIKTGNPYDKDDIVRTPHDVKFDIFDDWLTANKVIDDEQRDHDDEQRDQDPHRHEGLSDFDAEQRDQDPYRHEDDEDEPRRGISGYEHRPDALSSAAIQKPYVSMYKSNGKQVYDVLDGRGQSVHKTHDYYMAKQWLRDNYKRLTEK